LPFRSPWTLGEEIAQAQADLTWLALKAESFEQPA
jgi:hypothetical protein